MPLPAKQIKEARGSPESWAPDQERALENLVQLTREVCGTEAALLWFREGANLRPVFAGEAACRPDDGAIESVVVAADLVVASGETGFFAGAPVIGPEGAVQGVLAVSDRQTRVFPERERALFHRLAHLVNRELEIAASRQFDLESGRPNRTGFCRTSQHALQHCRRTGESAEVATFELTGLDAVRSELGEAEARARVQQFSAVLGRCFRASDVVGRTSWRTFSVWMMGSDRQSASAMVRMARIADEMDPAIRSTLRWSVARVAFDHEVHTAIDDLLEEAEVLLEEHRQARRFRDGTMGQ